MVSKRTKQCRCLKWLFLSLHVAVLVGPMLFFIPYAFSVGKVGEKVGLTMSTLVSLILLVFSIVSDVKHRMKLHKAILWILIGGIILCLESIDVRVFVWVMVIASIIDELVFCPIYEHYKDALLANIEIDRRGSDGQ